MPVLPREIQDASPERIMHAVGIARVRLHGLDRWRLGSCKSAEEADDVSRKGACIVYSKTTDDTFLFFNVVVCSPGIPNGDSKPTIS